jgi:hypothetical protein
MRIYLILNGRCLMSGSRLFCLILLPIFSGLLPAADFGQQQQYFAQLALGGGAETAFSLHNPNPNPLTVTLLLFRSDGSLITELGTEIPPSGSQTLRFGNSEEELTAGWAHLVSESNFIATEFFQITLGDQELPRVGVLPAIPANEHRMFGFVRTGETNTGIAMANPSESSGVEVRVKRFDGAGTLQEEAVVNLPPRGHLARFLDEDPLFPGLENYEGTLEVEADGPILLAMLRSDHRLLSAASVETPRAEELTAGAVTTDFLADGAVTGEKISAGTVVRSLNGLTDNVDLLGGDNVTISSEGNTITISASGGTGNSDALGDITAVLAGAGLSGGGEDGDVTLAVAQAGITTDMLTGNSVTTEVLADNSVGSAKLIDGSVGPDDLAPGSVTQEKIAGGSPGSGDVLAWNGASLHWVEPVVSGWEIVDQNYTMDATTTGGNYSVSCPPGKFVMGGGMYTPQFLAFTMRASYPAGTSGWTVDLERVGSGPALVFTVRAICANASP